MIEMPRNSVRCGAVARQLDDECSHITNKPPRARVSAADWPGSFASGISYPLTLRLAVSTIRRDRFGVYTTLLKTDPCKYGSSDLIKI